MNHRINNNLQCAVDKNKDDCRREPPHCHIIRYGKRVAQVWLEPVAIQSGHNLERSEINIVFDYVSDNRADLEREYIYNRNFGSD